MTPDITPTPEPSRGLQVCLLLVAAIYLIVTFVGSMWSDSVDLANHYALVARIAEYWTLPSGIDLSLGEMNSYPRISHVMAAIAGSWIDSPLVGIQLVSLASIIVLWASFIRLLQSLPGRLATRTLVAFVVLLVLNRVLLRFEIHGREVVGHFFYAQLVAQAVVALSLVLLLSMDARRIEASVRYAIFIALAYFCAGIHVLPALQLICLFGLVVVVEWTTHWRDGDAGNLHRGIAAAVFTSVGAALLVRHPAFSAMVEISRNNGTFSPKHLTSVGVIVAYALGIAILSATIVHRWFKSRHAVPANQLLLLKYLGLYGLAVAGLCLLQVVALQFGQGSEYAIKKHVFSLSTVLLLDLAVVPALLGIDKWQAGSDVAPKAGSFVHAYLLLPLLTVLAFYAVAPRKQANDTAQVVRLERALQQNRAALLARAPGKFAYLMPGPGVSPVIAYMMTIGILKSPRGPATQNNSLSIVRGQPLNDWPSVGTILQPGPLQPTQPAACLRPFPQLPVSVLDGQCVGRALAKVSSTVQFSTGQMPSPCTLAGFGSAEESFTWTTQKQASIDCPIPDIEGHPATSVTIFASAFLNRVPFQRASFSVNGGPAVDVRFDPDTAFRTISLGIPVDAGTSLRINMTLPDAISPKDAGVSSDSRQLGLAVSRLEFK